MKPRRREPERRDGFNGERHDLGIGCGEVPAAKGFDPGLGEGLLVDSDVARAQAARIGAGRLVRKQKHGRSQDDRKKSKQTPHFGPHKQL